MSYQVLYVESLSVIIVLVVILFAFRRIGRKGQKADELDAIYLIVIAMSVLDIIWMLIDGKAEYRVWNIALQVLYLTVQAPAGYLWLCHTIKHLPTQQLWVRKISALFVIPMVVVIAAVVLSVRTGWMFYVDADGTYFRGRWHICSVLVQFAYLIIASVVALQCRHNSTLTEEKRRYGVEALFPIPALILASLQMMLPPGGLPSMQAGVLIALFLQQGVSQMGMITRDYLTDLPNRVALERVLRDKTQHYKGESGKHLYLMSCELDHMKEINGTQGHEIGDRALIMTANGMRKVFYPKNMVVFRTGGDAFMVIGETNEALTMEAMRDEVNETLREWSKNEPFMLQMNMGMIEYDGRGDFAKMIERADRDLYIEKKYTPGSV